MRLDIEAQARREARAAEALMDVLGWPADGKCIRCRTVPHGKDDAYCACCRSVATAERKAREQKVKAVKRHPQTGEPMTTRRRKK